MQNKFQGNKFGNSVVRGVVLVCLLAAAVTFAGAQERGSLTGSVVDAAGKPVADATVIVVNQVNSRPFRITTGADGHFTIRLAPGAYRVSVERPYVTKFPTDKDYGPFTRPTAVALENVLVEPGKDTKLDIPVDKLKDEVTPAKVGDQPNGAAGNDTVASEPQTDKNRREERDRWRVGFPEYDRYGDKGARGRDIPFKHGHWYDPYDQSILKGDYPIWGNDKFMILSAVSTSSVEIGRTPKPTGVSSQEPGSSEFFGRPETLAASETIQFSFELFKGNTVFRPRDWAIKISPTFSVPNYVNARENGVIDIDPHRGTSRVDTQISLEEAFVEKKLFNTDTNYDFVSVRVGIQPFVSDFRGFVFSDNNLGARVFGAFANNRYQFNLAYFDQLEKDTNSGLNRFDTRKQNVYVANLYRQDFLTKGYTIQVSGLFNDDHGTRHFDRNGFLVRPTLIGDVAPNTVEVGYVGINGDGHIGRLNLTNSYYYAFGHEAHNPIAGKKVQVRSQMAAVEASMDHDFMRFRASAFWASGDKNPTDNKATGFDAILDDPNFVGGQFSFFNRQGIRLTQTGVGLVQPNSLLPSLRSSKLEGQANFVNPGIFIYNVGMDLEVTQRLKAILNVNYLRFDRTEPLEYVLFQPNIRHDIGIDYNLGIAYRPFLINNFTLTFGGAILQPGRGFRDIFTDRNRNCPFPDFCAPIIIAPNKPLYALFAQSKLVF